MRSTVFPEDQGATRPEATVTVNGKAVAAASLSLTSEVPSHLPAQVSGVGGVTAATGSVDVEIGAGDVSNQVPTPWTGTVPAPGDTVTVDIGRDGKQDRVLTGTVEDSGGSASDGVLSFGVTDEIRRLDKPVTIPALAQIMPAPNPNGSTNPMNVGLVSSYFVDRVLRECGYYATPPMPARTVFSAPLVGSTLPERGTIINSRRDATWREQPYFAPGWSAIMGNRLYAEYIPDLGYHAAGNLSRPMEINLTAAATQETSCRVSVEFENGARIGVVITSSRSLLVQFQTVNATEWTTYATATDSDIGRGWQRASIRIEATGDRRGTISIKTNNRGSFIRRDAALPWGSEHLPMTRAVIDLRGNDVGGVQVAFPANPSGYEEFESTADIGGPVRMASLIGSRPIIDTPAIELLKEWSEAECAAMWIDDDGVFKWRSRKDFTAGPIAWEGDSLNDLFDYEWSHAADGARSGVTIKYKDVAVKRSNRYRVDVWQGSGQTMEPGDEFPDFAVTPNDEAWIGVDSYPFEFQAETSKQAFNRGEGTWVGYTAYDKDGEQAPNTEWVGYAGDVQRVNWETWKITESWLGRVPGGVDHIKTQTVDAGTALKKQWQGFNLPILRAQCKLTFAEVGTSVNLSAAPQWAPALVHDVGWWIQHLEDARSLAGWLAQQTVRPLPVIGGIRLRPHAGLQIGDKVRLTDRHRTGVAITGVIVRRSHDIAHAQHSMSLGLQVTNITSTNPTLLDYDHAWGNATWGERDITWLNQTLAQFDAEPLRR